MFSILPTDWPEESSTLAGSIRTTNGFFDSAETWAGCTGMLAGGGTAGIWVGCWAANELASAIEAETKIALWSPSGFMGKKSFIDN
jgi:hypothetical protein